MPNAAFESQSRRDIGEQILLDFECKLIAAFAARDHENVARWMEAIKAIKKHYGITEAPNGNQ